MTIREDRTIILRAISRRIVESFLLILGLALGIGAAAAGIALVSRTMTASKEMLASPEYREIIVSTREDTTEMEIPAIVDDDTERAVITSIDLQAANDAPDVRYAYLKNNRIFRNQAAMIERFQSGGGIGGGKAGGDTGGGGSMPPPPEDPAAGSPPNAQTAQRQGIMDLMNSLDLSGPQPVMEEWYGYAVSPEYFDAWGLHAARGSLFTLADIASGGKPMILGTELAETLYDGEDPLGRKVLIFREIYTIAGILEPTGNEIDRLAFAPAFMPDIQGEIDSSNPMAGRMRFNTTLSFMVDDYTRLDEAADQLRQYFDREYGAGRVVITIPREEAEATRDRNSRLVTIILFLALAGLFIAGVNVSNILLSRALRRQKTVGILKALGSSKHAIFKLFFSEALIIGLGGTAVGVVISIFLAGLMQRTINLGRINPVMLAVGVGISWIITTVLTIFPAMQASRIPAADAIRSE